MNAKWLRYSRLSILSFLGALLLWVGSTIPSYAHWADLAVAEIVVGKTDTQITLTFPTGLIASADDNRDGELSLGEFRLHQAELQSFLNEKIHLSNGDKESGILTVEPSQVESLPSNLKVSKGSHSTLLLTYTWSKPVQGLEIHYDLFLPGVPTASCLATILEAGESQNVMFTPEKREFSLNRGSNWLSGSNFLIAIAGSFIWGAMHAMSPGHGKTIIGAYLVGSRATAQHAVFLGLTTTIAHTTGVFALGLVTLFASRFIVPEQLYPWLSLISGLIVLAIGLNLFITRSGSVQFLRKLPWKHSYAGSQVPIHHSHDHHHFHTHDHQHEHHHQEQEHSHTHEVRGSPVVARRGLSDHSHLPPGADGSPLTWRSLLALGISGGLLPCPSALVVLLSSIALGNTGFGLLLVLAFSLGLAGVLTGVGLLLVFARRMFERLPTSARPMKILQVLPALSSLVVALLGLGITMQALVQIGLVRLY